MNIKQKEASIVNKKKQNNLFITYPQHNNTYIQAHKPTGLFYKHKHNDIFIIFNTLDGSRKHMG